MSKPPLSIDALQAELRTHVPALQISADFLEAGFTSDQLKAIAMLLSASTDAMILGVAKTLAANNERLSAAP